MLKQLKIKNTFSHKASVLNFEVQLKTYEFLPKLDGLISGLEAMEKAQIQKINQNNRLIENKSKLENIKSKLDICEKLTNLDSKIEQIDILTKQKEKVQDLFWELHTQKNELRIINRDLEKANKLMQLKPKIEQIDVLKDEKQVLEAKNRSLQVILKEIHLNTSKSPICRTDNFIDTLISKMKFISELQKKHNCQVFHAGDLFHHWKPSPELLSIAIEHLPKQFCTVYGNHDLPQHNLELAKKSGIYLLNKAGILHLLDGTHWNQKVKWFGKMHCLFLVVQNLKP